MLSTTSCPCGSKHPYSTCCEPLHVKQNAPTAISLMRSRYCAFVMGLVDYLVATTHPSQRTPHLKEEITFTCKELTWQTLSVLKTWQGSETDKVGKVEFKATYTQNGTTGIHHECSRFKRYKGTWVYVDGEIYA